MYLAEDRILCWELVSKRGGSWILHYVKSAYGVTDTPSQVAELVLQRRRWLNGSFFAALHATTFQFRIWTSGQSFLRKIVLQFEFWYNAIQMVFAWTSLANFYLAFYFVSLLQALLVARADAWDTFSWFRAPHRIQIKMRSTF